MMPPTSPPSATALPRRGSRATFCDEEMKEILAILILSAATVGSPADEATNGPASTPEDLGRRVAAALRMGSTDGVDPLLPPYEAAKPLLGFSMGDAARDETQLKRYHGRKMERMKDEIARFPKEFEKATTNRADQIVVVNVERQQRKGNTNFADVDITFSTTNAQYLMVLDECLCWSNHWYLFDLDWMGKQEIKTQNNTYGIRQPADGSPKPSR